MVDNWAILVGKNDAFIRHNIYPISKKGEMKTMMKKTVLIFEGCNKINSLVTTFLTEQDYEIVVACDMEVVRKMMGKHQICMILADPECLEIGKLRRNFSEIYPGIPIIYINCLFGFEVILSHVNQQENYFLVEDYDEITLLNRINKILPKKGSPFKHVLDGHTELTPQEKRILCLLERGNTNQEIADTIGLTLATVRTYNYVLFQKLSVKNRTHAIMVAKEANII